jgi:HAD superfamily hydrolase (TIGR01509 family)
MNFSAPFAALFDWDGVILDSSSAHEKSWERLAIENSFTLPEGHFKRGFGRKNESIIAELLAWSHDPFTIQKLSLRKEELYREIVKEIGQSPLPGVVNFLNLLDHHGIPCAIASSTHRANIELSLGLLQLTDRFQSLITAEDVSEGKPNPQVFLKAGQALGFPPEKCLVLEDAQVGLDAAAAAGMTAVGVATTHPPGTLKGARCVVTQLDEIEWNTLSSWFSPGN